jgi:hypothetical protein
MRIRPVRRATSRLVLVIGALCVLVGLLQASIALLGWPDDLQRAAYLVGALLLLGLGTTLISFRRW